MTKSLALDPHDPSLVEIYYHHAPAFCRVSLRLFGIGISLVYCRIHLHGCEWPADTVAVFKKKSLQPSTHCRAVTKGNVAFGMWGLTPHVRS